MSDPSSHNRLVAQLVRDARPVHPLPSPLLRTLLWVGAALALGLSLLPMHGPHGLHTSMAPLDLALATLGAGFTALCAALAAFQTSVPGRPLRWALLPLPPALLWIGASGFGCLRSWTAPGIVPATPLETEGCFLFLVSVSVPLSILMVVMLRRAFPVHPNLTAALGGLATAAAASVLLAPFHPHDATATDLLVHLVAVALVIGLNRVAGGRILDAAVGNRNRTGR